MPKQIKKHGKKALIFGLMILVAVMYVTVVPVRAVDLSKERDTLSDSQPGVIAKHTVIFKATTAVPVSGHVIIDLPDAFTTPAMTFADVAISWDSSDPPTTACTMAASCSDTECCVTVTTALDKVDITLKGTGGGILQNDYVKVVIGDGAAGGLVDISNPAAETYYAVDIKTQNAAAEDIDTGKAMVYIIAGVTVEATVAESLSFSRIGLAAGSCLGDTGTIDTTINTSGDANAVPFGTLGNNFTVACQELTVSTNAANGYVVTEQEDDQLRFDSTTFPDCTCDSGTPCANADSNAAAWLTDAGFGHGCEKGATGDGVVCAAAYDVWGVGKYFYRQFASIADGDTAQTLMTYTVGAPTEDHVAIVHYKIKKPGTQAAGTYQNKVVYIATPTY